MAGALFYALASAQGTLQAFRSANTLLHFTNNTIGHAHFTAYGFVSFLMFGAIYGASMGAEGTVSRARLQFWLSLIGLALYVVAMTAAGLLQGISWASDRPFIESVIASAPWYAVRAVGGSMMMLGHVVLAWHLWQVRPQPHRLVEKAAAPEPAL